MLRRFLEVLWVFTQIGITSFGGPATSIALMQQALVQKRQWLSRQEFMDFVGVSSLIPGPMIVQLSLHLGYRRAGLWGAFAAVAGFVVSAAAITWLCAIVYVGNQKLPQLDACLQGIRPAVMAVILFSLCELGSWRAWGLSDFLLLAGTAAAFLAGGNPFLVLVAATIAGTALKRWFPSRQSAVARRTGKNADAEADQEDPGGTHLFLPYVWSGIVPAAAGTTGLSLWWLFLTFAKIGLFLYGGGNVIAAYLSNDFVKTGILTHQQLLDALAVGQSTPGPIITIATFIGYLLGGHLGAVAATAGIITPCIVMASLLHSLVRKVRRQRWAAGLFDALSVAVLGLILGVWLDLARQVFTQPLPMLLGIVCLVLLWKLRVSSVRLILASALTGLLLWG